LTNTAYSIAPGADAVLIRFAGEIFEPLVSGGLYWPAHDMLLVADLHLDKMASFARRGQLLPPYDTAATLRRLEADIQRTGAKIVLALGDSFHRNESVMHLSDLDRARLDGLTERCDWIWLSGNHDSAAHEIGGLCVPDLEHGGLTFMHEPRRGVAGLVSGHLHPAARIAVDGRSVRRPCFVHDNRQMILPAYGVSTGTLNILSPAFTGLLRRDALEVAMLARDRIYPVSTKRLVAG
jgi:DNA ligase-associated metallophosphoesterase